MFNYTKRQNTQVTTTNTQTVSKSANLFALLSLKTCILGDIRVHFEDIKKQVWCLDFDNNKVIIAMLLTLIAKGYVTEIIYKGTHSYPVTVILP